jgi:hypothetical protein
MTQMISARLSLVTSGSVGMKTAVGIVQGTGARQRVAGAGSRSPQSMSPVSRPRPPWARRPPHGNGVGAAFPPRTAAANPSCRCTALWACGSLISTTTGWPALPFRRWVTWPVSQEGARLLPGGSGRVEHAEAGPGADRGPPLRGATQGPAPGGPRPGRRAEALPVGGAGAFPPDPFCRGWARRAGRSAPGAAFEGGQTRGVEAGPGSARTDPRRRGRGGEAGAAATASSALARATRSARSRPARAIRGSARRSSGVSGRKGAFCARAMLLCLPPDEVVGRAYLKGITDAN